MSCPLFILYIPLSISQYLLFTFCSYVSSIGTSRMPPTSHGFLLVLFTAVSPVSGTTLGPEDKVDVVTF